MTRSHHHTPGRAGAALIRSPIALAAALALTAAPLPAADLSDFPRPKVGYSGTRVLEMQNGTMVQKVYHEDGRERAETTMQGMSAAIILRPDLELVWIVMPQQGMYMEASTADAADLPGNSPTDIEIVEFSDRGAETVDGVRTRRYEVRTRTQDGTTHDGTVWLDAQNIPVRMQAVVDSEGTQLEMVMRLTDLELGDQPDHLFDPPQGAQKLDLGAGGLGALGALGGAARPGGAGAPGTTGAGNAASSPSQGRQSQPGLGDEMVDAATQGAKEGAKQEVKHQAVKKVRRGLRKIFE